MTKAELKRVLKVVGKAPGCGDPKSLVCREQREVREIVERELKAAKFINKLCKVCTHEKRDEIDAALESHAETLRMLEKSYGVSRTSLSRHRRHASEGTWEPWPHGPKGGARRPAVAATRRDWVGIYLSVLHAAADEGREFLTSYELGAETGRSSRQARYDMLVLGVVGRQRMGYQVSAALRRLEEMASCAP